jgi:hypothetical protein
MEKLQLKKSSSHWERELGKYWHTVKYELADISIEDDEEIAWLIVDELQKKGILSEEINKNNFIAYIAYTGKQGAEASYWFIMQECLSVEIYRERKSVIKKSPKEIFLIQK